jgi:flagellar protein FlgJ
MTQYITTAVEPAMTLRQNHTLPKIYQNEQLSAKVDTARERKILQEACSNFEALFLQHLFQAMRKTVPESGLLSGGYGQDIYTSLMDQETAKVLAERNATGIAQLLIQHFERSNPNKPETD